MKSKTCMENKVHNLPVSKNNRVKAKDILVIIHTDVYSSFKTFGLNKEIYFVSFIHNCSESSKVY